MKVSGSHVVHASREAVWDALQDPQVLVQTIPGCHELRAVGDDAYEARVHAGIASITGTYDGRVELSDHDPPNSYRLRATGSGGPGTIEATALVSLEETDDGVAVSYDADAVVGGAIAGVGQRVVSGVAKRNAAAFFEAVDAYLTGAPEQAAEAAPDVAGEPGVTAEEREPAAPVVHRRPPEPAAPRPVLHLLAAAAVGAAIALAGVLVGQRRRG
jgi:carbon monoxide dehydrogenase subunit G